jgi:hypothetical protein
MNTLEDKKLLCNSSLTHSCLACPVCIPDLSYGIESINHTVNS